ncbi:MAG: hypothetical protein DMF22_11250 [Verrucomicrobia bacterium]|nr:MAG: hypothetical protein DME81_07755 [Verrucomicrobiota bacterium]PYL69416.1 MAG: hypothetical protein DMF22_11250 [Verrucomicrobiota bacterium]
MRRFSLLLVLLFTLVSGGNAFARNTEWIIVVGGPSLYQWEHYKTYPHDHWWANFIRAARLRTEQLRGQLGPDALITWLVYKQGYLDRAQQEHQDLIGFINSVGDKYHLNLVYFHAGSEVINYLNSGQPRRETKIAGFEYFGHSNRACFMFDYSNVLDSASKSWLHENDLSKIQRTDFVYGAYVKSWGCHTGEEMSKKWHAATGTHMIGAIGKTQFMMEELPILTSENGKWVN